MADTQDPGNWLAIGTFVGAAGAAIVAFFAGLKRGDQRASRGYAEGDPATLGGGALFLDAKPMQDIAKELAGCRRELARLAKHHEAAGEREEQRRHDARDARMDARDARMDELLELLRRKEDP